MIPTIPASISRATILELAGRLVGDAHRVTHVVITATEVAVTYMDADDHVITVVVAIDD